MSVDSPAPDEADSTVIEANPEPSAPDLAPNLQVRFKTRDGKLFLCLPPATSEGTALPWAELWEQLKHRLTASERFWVPQTVVYLLARDRLLDVRQLQTIADALHGAQLELKWVYTNRRQTAVAAATSGYSVKQSKTVAHFNQSPPQPGTPLDDPLYLQSTIRSGVEIRHTGTVIVLGDVNPGGNVRAEGDILIWGRLKGIAHAGCNGNTTCRIMALHMEPTQLRIADKVARPPETPPNEYLPEVAYIGEGGIRIAPAKDFARWLTEHSS